MTIEYALNQPLTLDNFVKIVDTSIASFHISIESVEIRPTPMPGFISLIYCPTEANHALIDSLAKVSLSNGMQLDDLEFREHMPGGGIKTIILK